MVKVLKHLRSRNNIPTVSFFIECLLYSLPEYPFWGSPATYIRDVLEHLASRSAGDWYLAGLQTPCGDRNIFSASEWSFENWNIFHQFVQVWAKFARLTSDAPTKQFAIQMWQELLGSGFFPATVSS